MALQPEKPSKTEGGSEPTIRVSSLIPLNITKTGGKLCHGLVDPLTLLQIPEIPHRIEAAQYPVEVKKQMIKDSNGKAPGNKLKQIHGVCNINVYDLYIYISIYTHRMYICIRTTNNLKENIYNT